MEPDEELLALERGFWTEGVEYYREHIDAQCLLVFQTQSSVMTAAEVAATIEKGPRWRSVRMEQCKSLVLSSGVRILSYQAVADRAGDETYSARIGSAYVRRGSQWKLAFHQHTPLAQG